MKYQFLIEWIPILISKSIKLVALLASVYIIKHIFLELQATKHIPHYVNKTVVSYFAGNNTLYSLHLRKDHVALSKSNVFRRATSKTVALEKQNGADKIYPFQTFFYKFIEWMQTFHASYRFHFFCIPLQLPNLARTQLLSPSNIARLISHCPK